MLNMQYVQRTGKMSELAERWRAALRRVGHWKWRTPSLDEIRQHWSSRANYDDSWSERGRHAVILAGQFFAACDIGCGPKMSLSRHLAPGTRYLPCDAHGWSDDVEVCDLASLDLPLQSIEQSDVVFVLGVLEYLPDVPAALRALAARGRPIVFSYCSTDISRRRDRWWLNGYTSLEIAALAAAAGLTIQRSTKVGAAQLVYYAVPTAMAEAGHRAEGHELQSR